MNISAISMVNRMPSFSAQKQIIHRNSDEDWWVETVDVKEPQDEVVIHRNSDEDWYAAPKNKPHTTNESEMREIEEKKLREANSPKTNAGMMREIEEGKLREANVPRTEETEQEYYARKLYSPEWVG